MASRKLDDLCPSVRPKFIELLARCIEAGLPVMLVNVLRTDAEQADNLAKGVSWTKNSKHLPQVPCKLSHAIDVAPYDIFALHGPDKLQWDINDPVWEKIGLIGEALGMRWGGRWQQKDMGHFELQGH